MSDLPQLLREHVDDVTTPDLVAGAWRRGRRRRARSALAGVAGAVVAVALVATGASVLSGGPTADRRPPVAGPSQESGTPTDVPTSTASVDLGLGPQARYDGLPVSWSPTPAQEATLPRESVPVAMPATVDLSAAAPDVARDPVPSVLAAYAVSSTAAGGAPGPVDRLVLVADDGTLRQLDVPDAGVTAGATAVPWMVSPLGTRVVLSTGAEGVAVYDLATGAWRAYDTRGLPRGSVVWQGDTDLVFASAPGELGDDLELDTGRHSCCSGTHVDLAPDVGQAHLEGRSRTGDSGLAIGWAGTSPLPLPPGTPSGAGFLQVVDRAWLVLSGEGPGAGGELATWTAGDRLVYARDGQDGGRLVAWRVGSTRFGLVSTITGVPDGDAWQGSYARWDLG